VPLNDQPINVWYSDGVRYEDYRQADGRITTKAKHVCRCGHGLLSHMGDDGECTTSVMIPTPKTAK
jgi:hypothetical protein